MAINDTTLKKHSIVIAGHQTSVTLENIFWNQLKDIAAAQNISLSKLVADIDSTREGNLSSAIRVFVLKNSLTA
ncbi:MAG: ribbon-helix-helix domain-containing protein [Emcibacter sp.]|nr:ribbon-helix-helix domain-containing protein [Emcibacter sp.]HEC01269.1 aryl-sulfate sulfotransferase [Sphingomonadales bacterium]